MSESTQDKIYFEVETARVLRSSRRKSTIPPLLCFREKRPNAYDAVLMRCTQDGSDLRDATNKSGK